VPPPEGPWRELLLVYREHGYVRRPRRRPGRDRDWEVRFVFQYAWEARELARLLEATGFPAARSSRRHRFLVFVIPGRLAVERIVGLYRRLRSP